jgi:hypothetical protein
LTKELCNLDRTFDEKCMDENRTRFFDRAIAIAGSPGVAPDMVYTAAYVIVFIEHHAYRSEEEFNADLGPRLCALDSELMWSFFEEARADVGAMRRACGQVPASSEPERS